MPTRDDSLQVQVEHLQHELLQAKARLRMQQQMSVIFTHSPIPISLSRLQDGVFVDVNARWAQVTGLSLEQVQGRTAFDIGIWGYANQRDNWLRTDQGDGQLAMIEMPFVRPDGGRRIFEYSGSKVEIGGEDFLLVYLRDVTRAHATAAELLASEQLLKVTNTRLQERLQFIDKIASRAPGVIFQLRRSPQGVYKFLYVAEPIKDIYVGFSAEQAMGDMHAALALHYREDLGAYLHSIETSAAEQTPWVHE